MADRGVATVRAAGRRGTPMDPGAVGVRPRGGAHRCAVPALLAAALGALALATPAYPVVVRQVRFVWPVEIGSPIHQDLPFLLKMLGVTVGQDVPVPYQPPDTLEQFLRNQKAFLVPGGGPSPTVSTDLNPSSGLLTVTIEGVQEEPVLVGRIEVRDFPPPYQILSGERASAIEAAAVQDSERTAAGYWQYYCSDLVLMRDDLPNRLGPSVPLARAEYCYDSQTKVLTIRAGEAPTIDAILMDYSGAPEGSRLAPEVADQVRGEFLGRRYAEFGGQAGAQEAIRRAFAREYVRRGFRAVRVSVAKPPDAGPLYGLCTVHVAPGPWTRKTHKIEIEASSESPSGRAAFAAAYADINFGARAETLSVQAGLGGYQGAEVRLSAVQDALHPRPWQIAAARWRTLQVPFGTGRFDETRTSVLAELPVISGPARWEVGWQYRWSRDRLVPVEPGETQTTTTGIAGVRLRHDPSGLFLAPPRPQQPEEAEEERRRFPVCAELGTEVAGRWLGGGSQFLIATAEARTYWEPTSAWLLALRVGGAWASGGTPVSEQPWLGGNALPGLLRAHDPEALRGRQVAYANLEARHALAAQFDALAFVDAAKVADGPLPTRGVDADVGIGARYYLSPALPVALYWAWGNEGGRFSFVLSPGF